MKLVHYTGYWVSHFTKVFVRERNRAVMLNCYYHCLTYRTKHNLKVREHKTLGPYVEGLSTLAVRSFWVTTRDVSSISSTRCHVGY